MDAATDAELRLARRLKLGVRLVVYPTLLVLVAVAWHARQARGEEEAPLPSATVVWRGTTEQGSPASIVFLHDGRVAGASFDLRLSCGASGTERFVWTPSSDLYVQSAGGHVTAHRPQHLSGQGSVYEAWLDAQIGHRSAHGIVTLRDEGFDHGVRSWTCAATDVAFDVRPPR